MKIDNRGFVGVDVIVSIIAILTFSTLIFTLMYNNALANVKLKKQSLATIYLTEVLENVGIASYADLNTQNLETFMQQQPVHEGYTLQIEINDSEQSQIKKVKVTFLYEVADKTYSCSMERKKIEE